MSDERRHVPHPECVLAYHGELIATGRTIMSVARVREDVADAEAYRARRHEHQWTAGTQPGAYPGLPSATCIAPGHKQAEGDEQDALAAAGILKQQPEDAYVWVHPGRHSGDPCIGGRRVPTEMVAQHYWDLDGDEHEVTMAYDITRDQMLVALWFEATYGRQKKWRGRYGDWAKEHAAAMWKSDWDAVPNPPIVRSSKRGTKEGRQD